MSRVEARWGGGSLDDPWIEAERVGKVIGDEDVEWWHDGRVIDLCLSYFFFFCFSVSWGGKVGGRGRIGSLVEFRNRVLFLFFKENGKFLDSWLDVVIWFLCPWCVISIFILGLVFFFFFYLASEFIGGLLEDIYSSFVRFMLHHEFDLVLFVLLCRYCVQFIIYSVNIFVLSRNLAPRIIY